MIVNVIVILFAAAAVVEYVALQEPPITFETPDDGFGIISAPDQAEKRKFRRLTVLALFLTTAGGFVSLWAPGFAS